ncbi:D-alanyl-D-alanine carboxypeptidase, partial [Streptomyces sp. NPDC005931]|uniref:D-alanyl-D-alanine carboxypeptidase n=1 Tax=Streptomyces sp. NPDC005931 TaxID=3364737 RepID=UPI0036A1A139
EHRAGRPAARNRDTQDADARTGRPAAPTARDTKDAEAETADTKARDAETRDATDDAPARTGDDTDRETEHRAGRPAARNRDTQDADARTGRPAAPTARDTTDGAPARTGAKAGALRLAGADRDAKDAEAEAGRQDGDAAPKAGSDRVTDSRAERPAAGRGARGAGAASRDAGGEVRDAEAADGTSAADGGDGDGGQAGSSSGAGARASGASRGRPVRFAKKRGDRASSDDDPAPQTGAPVADKPPVDQATAVFRAPRPSAPPVDQPTTMLKLGDAAKAPRAGDDGAEARSASDAASGAKSDADTDSRAGSEPGSKPTSDAGNEAGPKSGSGARTDAGSEPRTEAATEAETEADAEADADAGSKAESVSERTSKFVALKALDDPETRRPPVTPGTEATTALRAVTPAERQPADATTALPQIGPERTTQQPLPPKPPLDLLAELTNTPPPPDTPLRTAVRRVKIWTPLVLLLVIVFAVVQNMRPLPAPTLDLTARDSFTFEGSRVDIPWPSDGQAALDVQGIGTFGSSGEQKPVPIASVAKVMTAYLILRDHPLKSGAEGPTIDIDATAEKQSDAGQESTVKVTAGDKISQREAIESILIASANNVARLLARWDAGSEKAFVGKMNDAAKDLGMTNTTYTDPSGLNNTTVSTAVDQVKLARAAMKQPAFREVAAMMSYDDYKGVNHPNWNQLVGHNNVVGIKTGTTTSALGNLVFAAKKEVGGETRTVVGAVVRQPPGGADNTILAGALSAGDKLIRAAQDALESATILKKGTVVGYADDGLGGRTPVVVTEDVRAVGWAGLSVKLTFAADDLPHSAEAGTKVGTLTVGDGTSSAVKVPVALQDDLVEPGFADRLTRIA